MHWNCRRVAELLIEYVDGSMPVGDRSELERHLCGCVPCAIYLRTYHDTIQMTRALPDEPLPPEFAARLESMLLAECNAETDPE
jgi:anti-sigma factor RsiW